jgi:putative membrane protein
MSGKRPRRPAAFDLKSVRLEASADRPFEEAEAFGFAEAAGRPIATAEPKPRRARWSRLFWTAAGGLVALGLGLAVDNLVRTLFERTDWLGWLGIALVGLAGLALIGLAIREIFGLARLRRITHIQAIAATAIADDDRREARRTAAELIALYRGRPETARGRRGLSGHLAEIIDGRDLVGLAETELLRAFDMEARRLVLASAKRVSLVTAISPRALVDVLFVAVEILRMIRRLATLYGGRPGTIGFLRLTRRAIGHLAITGGMAAGESLFQQVLGHGIVARISTRLGEGVINGILTARIGLAAIDVCRPLPFVFAPQPRLADIIAELTRREGEEAEGSANPG